MKVEFETDEYFFTDFRYEQLIKAREEGVIQLDHSAEGAEIIGDGKFKIRKFKTHVKIYRNGRRGGV